MIKVSFNITESQETGLHTIQVVVENGNPWPMIDGLHGWFEAEMQRAKIEYKGPVCTIEFVTYNRQKAIMLRQTVTEYFFDQETKPHVN